MKRVAVDIGGTFTDCFVVWGNKFLQTKALTSHHNLALGFNEALDYACEALGLSRRRMLSGLDSIRYATTLGTNALIERKGAKLGLLVTAGFESTVPLSRGRGYGEGLPACRARDLGSAQRPDPLVPITLIRGIRQRTNYAGEELVALDENDVRLKIRELVDEGVQGIVVCLTNSVDNPEVELRVQQLFEEEYPPELLGAIPMILSHQVVGRKGEYVRATSTIVDAYLHNTMYYAMTALEQNLRDNGYTKPMLLVHNSGGMAQMSSTDALQTVHSGPVAGIHAAEELSKQSRIGNIVCGDMGGTSFDIGVVTEDAEMHYDFHPVVDRWRVTVPMVHLVTLGAGGGSIARFDRVFNSILVGPESAGSDPGPAAYDRGGMNPTVTDADLILGYLDVDKYANGQIKLNVRRSYQALEDICDELDIDETEACKLIKSFADTEMAAGIKRELNSHGYTAADFVFLAYGGNGPLHACGIARKAGIKKVLVPPYSAVFSASGGAGLNQMHIHERNVSLSFFHKNLKTFYRDFENFNAWVEELEARGRKDLLRQGIEGDRIQHRLELDMRYGIQMLEISIPIGKNRLHSVGDVVRIIQDMGRDFGDRYGTSLVSPESGVKVSTVRVVSFVETPTLQFEDMKPPVRKIPTPEPVDWRSCHFVGGEAPSRVPVYDVAALRPGIVIEGPAIVNLEATTYLVEPGWRYESAAQGAVWVIDATQSG